jgi:hypothetical protein
VNTVTYIFTVIAALAALLAVIELLRRKRVRERHTVWWLVAGVFTLLISVFPWILSGAAQILGIEVPLNLAFFVSVLILFFVSVQHGAELTILENKTRVLAEHIALIEAELREIGMPLAKVAPKVSQVLPVLTETTPKTEYTK